MNAITLAAGAALLMALAPGQATPTADTPYAMSGIEWRVTEGRYSDRPHLRLVHGKNNNEQGIDARKPDLAELRAAMAPDAPGPVRFTIDREAGTLSCEGQRFSRHEGKGSCRFVSKLDYERALAARGAPVQPRERLYTLAVIDATIARFDGLRAAGLDTPSTNDFIAATALDVTGGFVRDLKSAGMRIESMHDAIAAKALNIDGVYVRGLASAGYGQLSADQVISMKAVGVTPEYAQRMNAAARSKKDARP